MNKPYQSYTVNECKIQASILLKSLRSKAIENSQKAARRFQSFPGFKNLSLDEIVHADMKRKHALAVIANEKGFQSWADLKCQLPFIRGGFLNQWFANYAEAKSYQQVHGGFLLPYRTQFFMCDTHYIDNLGFDSEDPDWNLIGHDWVNPDNQRAWQRLYKKWMKIQDALN